jgi:hypothetical protein
MRIPKTLKVGGIHYAVKRRPQVKNKGEQACWGLTNYATAEIIVDSKLHGHVVEEVFIHEMTHAIFNQTGISNDVGTKEEEYVDRLSKGLYQVLKDNKMLR